MPQGSTSACNDNRSLQKVEKMKYPVVWIDPEFSFKPHIVHVMKEVNFSVDATYLSRHCFTLNVRKRLVSQLILPIMDYADTVYQNASKSHPLSVIYHRLCRFILGCSFFTHHCTMLDTLTWLPLDIRRQFHWYQFVFKCINLNYPYYQKQFFLLLICQIIH